MFTCLYSIPYLKFRHCHRLTIFQHNSCRRWEAIPWWWCSCGWRWWRCTSGCCCGWRARATVESATTLSKTVSGTRQNTKVSSPCWRNPSYLRGVSSGTLVTGIFICLETEVRTCSHWCTGTYRTLKLWWYCWTDCRWWTSWRWWWWRWWRYHLLKFYKTQKIHLETYLGSVFRVMWTGKKQDIV